MVHHNTVVMNLLTLQHKLLKIINRPMLNRQFYLTSLCQAEVENKRN